MKKAKQSFSYSIIAILVFAGVGNGVSYSFINTSCPSMTMPSQQSDYCCCCHEISSNEKCCEEPQPTNQASHSGNQYQNENHFCQCHISSSAPIPTPINKTANIVIHDSSTQRFSANSTNTTYNLKPFTNKNVKTQSIVRAINFFIHFVGNVCLRI